MEFKIEPRTGLNALRFGDDREEVRRVLSTTLGAYYVGSRGGDAYDYYSVAGLFAYYDSDAKLEALETSRPPKVMFSGAELLSMDLGAAIALLSRLGEEVTHENDGATSLSCGVALYAPLAKEDKSAGIESVLVFRDGYFD